MRLFTHYSYTTTDISITGEDGIVTVRSMASGLNITVDTGDEATLPARDLLLLTGKEARRFAGPLCLLHLPVTNIRVKC